MKKYADGGDVEDQRDLAKRRSMIAQKGAAKTKSDMRKAVKEVKTQRKTDEAYDGYYDRRRLPLMERAKEPTKKKAMGGKVMTYAKGGSIDGAAIKGKTKCKIC